MITDKKIQSSEVTRLHVQSAEDTLSGSPADNKAIFDRLPELIVARYNAALDEIASAVEGIGTGKQETLVSGTNIKTVNGYSILGSGDLTLQDSLSISDNVITLTRSDGTTSEITLPVYSGGVS